MPKKHGLGGGGVPGMRFRLDVSCFLRNLLGAGNWQIQFQLTIKGTLGEFFSRPPPPLRSSFWSSSSGRFY